MEILMTIALLCGAGELSCQAWYVECVDSKIKSNHPLIFERNNQDNYNLADCVKKRAKENEELE